MTRSKPQFPLEDLIAKNHSNEIREKAPDEVESSLGWNHLLAAVTPAVTWGWKAAHH